MGIRGTLVTLFTVFLVCFLCLGDREPLGVLSEAVRNVLGERGPSAEFGVEPDASYMQDLCPSSLNGVDRTRLACCSAVNGGILYLHNVQISGGRIVAYVGNGRQNMTTWSSVRTLPVINSVTRRKVKEFTLNVEARREKFSNAKCKSFFNGTLHVAGRQTTQNLYHVLNDNILPLLSHVVLDAQLAPDMLHAPRALLTGFQPAPDGEQVPHLEALLRVAFPKRFALGGDVDGVCFRRVAWGGGVKVMYQHLLGTVRRISLDLLREIVLLGFKPPNPYREPTDPAPRRRRTSGLPSKPMPHTSSAPSNKGHSGNHVQRVTGNQTSEAVLYQRTPWRNRSPVQPGSLAISDYPGVPAANKRPLNVVIYTRGSSGIGRTIGNEVLLRDSLNALGARAVICCDFREVSLVEQLGYAVHADVVLGLHGAGLVNSIIAPTGVFTVELKTAYGYGLTLFALAAEARRGTFIEVDVRDHFIWGKPGQGRNHPVDEELVGRVVAAIRLALEKREASAGHSSAAVSCAQREKQAESFRTNLFVSLPRPSRSSPPAGAVQKGSGKVLGGGDLMVLPYPAAEAQGCAAGPLDFLHHFLGPVVTEAPAQCEAMVLRRYWEFVGEKGVRGKYCLACKHP